MARESWHDLVVVEKAGLALDRAWGWLALISLNGGLWLVAVIGLLHGADGFPVLTLAGLILVDTAAVMALWWQEQQAECEAARSHLQLAQAVAEVRSDHRDTVVILPETR